MKSTWYAVEDISALIAFIYTCTKKVEFIDKNSCENSSFYEQLLSLILAVLHAMCEIRLAMFNIFNSILTWTNNGRRICKILLLFNEHFRFLVAFEKLRKANSIIVTFVYLQIEPSNKLTPQKSLLITYISRLNALDYTKLRS